MITNEELPINDLHVNPANPRIIRDESFRDLCKSVKDFPKMLQIRRVVIDADGMILGGEKRWLAAKQVGMKTIPVTRCTDMTQKEVQEFILRDNHHAGEFDMTALIGWDVDLLKDVGLWSDPQEVPVMETHGRKTGMRQIVFRYKEAEYNDVMKVMQEFMAQEKIPDREKFLRFLLSMPEKP